MKLNITFLWDENKFAIVDTDAADPEAPITDTRYTNVLTAVCDIIMFLQQQPPRADSNTLFSDD